MSALIHAATMVTAGGLHAGAAERGVRARAGRVVLGRRHRLPHRACSRPPSAPRRTTSNACSPTPPSPSSGTCSSPAGWARLRAGIFHVMTHAFFKALLFLGAGAVIHALHDEQDMWKMGGLRKHLNVTHLTFLIACLAIAGLPPFAGFFSKDEILWKTFSSGRVGLYVLGLLTAGLTAFYMFRLLLVTSTARRGCRPRISGTSTGRRTGCGYHSSCWPGCRSWAGSSAFHHRGREPNRSVPGGSRGLARRRGDGCVAGRAQRGWSPTRGRRTNLTGRRPTLRSPDTAIPMAIPMATPTAPRTGRGTAMGITMSGARAGPDGAFGARGAGGDRACGDDVSPEAGKRATDSRERARAARGEQVRDRRAQRPGSG